MIWIREAQPEWTHSASDAEHRAHLILRLQNPSNVSITSNTSFASAPLPAIAPVSTTTRKRSADTYSGSLNVFSDFWSSL